MVSRSKSARRISREACAGRNIFTSGVGSVDISEWGIGGTAIIIIRNVIENTERGVFNAISWLGQIAKK